MPLQGDLKEFGIPEVFQLLEQQEKTGCLLIDMENQVVEVYFEEGRIAGAFSGGQTPAEAFLKHIEKLGLLSEKEVAAVKRQREKDLRSIPDILKEKSVIGRKDIDVLLREHLEELIFPIFERRRGSFSFVQDKTLSAEWVLSQPSPVEPLILEGLRQTDEWPLLKKRVGSLEEVPQRQLVLAGEKGSSRKKLLEGFLGRKKTEPGLSENDLELDGEEFLSSQEKMVYNLIDGKRNLGDIICSSGLGNYSACKAFLSLVDRDWVRLAAPKTKILPEPEDSVVQSKVGLVQGYLIMAGLILLLLGAQLVTKPQQMPWVGEVFTRGSFPLSRLLNYHQRERIFQALQVYHEENGEFPEELSSLVQVNLIGSRALLPRGANRFLYQLDPVEGYRLLIVPAH